MRKSRGPWWDSLDSWLECPIPGEDRHGGTHLLEELRYPREMTRSYVTKGVCLWGLWFAGVQEWMDWPGGSMWTKQEGALRSGSKEPP